MFRSQLLPLSALVMALVLISPDSTSSEEGDCGTVIDREPAVFYNVTGTTLAGPVHKSLAVYSDGSAVFTEFSFNTSPTILNGAVEPADVERLKQELANAGAYSLCDQPTMVADVPLRTVTVFRGGSDSLAHTYNYWLASEGYSDVQTTLDAFVDYMFPQE